MQRENFKVGQRLKPAELYYAAIGLFKNNKFFLVDTIGEGEKEKHTYQEKARVYRKIKDGKLYILYYPGKDNNEPVNPEKPTESLQTIVYFVNSKLKFSPSQLSRARKFFIVAENNNYMGVPIAHYIKADLSGDLLTTADSIDRDYDESFIRNLIPHTRRKVIKRGWQNMVFNHWACGYYALEEIRRDITDIDDPDDLTITAAIVEAYYQRYQSGVEELKNQKKKSPQNSLEFKKNEMEDGTEDEFAEEQKSGPQNELKDNQKDEIDDFEKMESQSTSEGESEEETSDEEIADDKNIPAKNKSEIINIPVTGLLVSEENPCFLPVKKLEASLRKHTQDAKKNYVEDKNLDIVVSKNRDNNLVLRVYTNKTVSLFTEMEIKKINNYYELTIETNNNTYPGLLGVCIKTDSERKYIDVAHLFDLQEIKQIKSNAEIKNQNFLLNEQNGEEKALLGKIKEINRYLCQRAQETSSFLSFFGRYSGQDYYLRRQSWKNILEQIERLILQKTTLKKLKDFINGEAKKFDKLFGRSQYHDLLKELVTMIPDRSSFAENSDFHKLISTYHNIYDEMDFYSRSTLKYIHGYSLFGSNKAIAENVERESIFYASYYQALSESDKGDFLNLEEERLSEYKNINSL